MLRYYQDIFNTFDAISYEMFHKARVVNALDEKRAEERKKELRKGWDVVKAKMRWRYDHQAFYHL